MNDIQEVLYWQMVEIAYTIAKPALERGVKPADLVEAANMGIEGALRHLRADQDNALAGH